MAIPALQVTVHVAPIRPELRKVAGDCLTIVTQGDWAGCVLSSQSGHCRSGPCSNVPWPGVARQRKDPSRHSWRDLAPAGRHSPDKWDWSGWMSDAEHASTGTEHMLALGRGAREARCSSASRQHEARTTARRRPRQGRLCKHGQAIWRTRDAGRSPARASGLHVRALQARAAGSECAAGRMKEGVTSLCDRRAQLAQGPRRRAAFR